MTHRHINLEGGWNFRDIGDYAIPHGKRTRSGLIYRSGGLNHLTDADRDALNKLGVRSVFDLRSDAEREHEGEDQSGKDVAVHHFSTSLGISAIRDQINRDPDNFRMRDFYCSSLRDRTEFHADLFQHIVASLDSPLVIHCSAGKDRTGIIIALLLRVAGVSNADIIADYVETDSHLVEYGIRQAERFRGFGMPEQVIVEMLGCAPINMESMLIYLDSTFGSAEEYLLAGGVTEDQLEAFRGAFIEPA